MQYTICQWAINRFRPSELTKHHPRCPLTVMMPLFECLKDYKKFFIIYIIVQFSKAKCPRVESNRVNILSSVCGYNGCQSVVRYVCFYNHWEIRVSVHQDKYC